MSATNKIITPGRIPLATTSQKGISELATSTEANALTDATRTITPATIPQASTTQKGIARAATAAENDAGTSGIIFVIASELKRKYDALVALISGSTAFTFSGVPATNVTIAQLSGNYSGKNQFITGRLTKVSTTGSEDYIATIVGYQSPGFEVYFPLSASINTNENAYGRIATNGNIYVKFFNNGTWNFAVPIIGA